MKLTDSYIECFSPVVLGRFQFAETRNATRILKCTNALAFAQIDAILAGFELKDADLIMPGGQESDLAARLNSAFRSVGWREARVDTLIRLSLHLTPIPALGDSSREPVITETENKGYKVDNFRDRIALDVEWNAKDGNLDRDIAAYRALYDAALIDAGILISRTLRLRELACTRGIERGMPPEKAKRLLNTTTTTNNEKLVPRLTRGDAGGCPVLAVFISSETYVAG